MTEVRPSGAAIRPASRRRAALRRPAVRRAARGSGRELSSSGSSLEISSIAAPPPPARRSARGSPPWRRRRRRASARRGSASSHSAASHRASTTFCWLPPDSPPTTASELGVRTRSCRKYVARQLALLGADESTPARQPVEHRQRRVVQRRSREHEPLPLAILGHEADPERDRVARTIDRARPCPRTMIRPDVGGSSAEQRRARRPSARRQRGRPAPRPRRREARTTRPRTCPAATVASTRSTSSLDAASSCRGKYSASGARSSCCTSSRLVELGRRLASRRAVRRAARVTVSHSRKTSGMRCET